MAGIRLCLGWSTIATMILTQLTNGVAIGARKGLQWPSDRLRTTYSSCHVLPWRLTRAAFKNFVSYASRKGPNNLLYLYSTILGSERWLLNYCNISDKSKTPSLHRLPRLFVEKNLSIGDYINFDSIQSNYLASVMRLKQGSYCLVFDGMR
eukprot:1349253-Amorphochlora_amoeboformis.AAC.2